MQKFVFWTGAHNLSVGSVFLIPGSTNIRIIRIAKFCRWPGLVFLQI